MRDSNLANAAKESAQDEFPRVSAMQSDHERERSEGEVTAPRGTARVGVWRRATAAGVARRRDCHHNV
jgi:hypothetical protein